MVVLNFYGEIEPVCISEKLGLFVSNLPNTKFNEWKDALVDDLELAFKTDKIYRGKIGIDCPCGIVELYHKLFPEEDQPLIYGRENFEKIANKMICIYMKYTYGDMPLGGWDTNCFDGRLCEEDYTEKIIDFINYISMLENPDYILPKPVPQWTYSSNYDGINHCRIFWGGEPAAEYIPALKEWGHIFDNFLCGKADYLLFDYLVNTIHKDNEYNESHLMKSFSLCQLFLENGKKGGIDKKLSQFITSLDLNADMIRQAQLFRNMRNKIAHGDFLEFENIVETYATEFLDGHFAFDYSEYSRKNWTIQHVCCELDDAVRKMICMLLFDKAKLMKIKNTV